MDRVCPQDLTADTSLKLRGNVPNFSSIPQLGLSIPPIRRSSFEGGPLVTAAALMWPVDSTLPSSLAHVFPVQSGARRAAALS